MSGVQIDVKIRVNTEEFSRQLSELLKVLEDHTMTPRLVKEIMKLKNELIFTSTPIENTRNEHMMVVRFSTRYDDLLAKIKELK